MSKWVYKHDNDDDDNKVGGGRIILLGDAAHPPVPCVGQGGQMGIEDAGTIALLMKCLCCSDDNDNSNSNDNNASTAFLANNVDYAMSMYEQMRIQRTSDMLDNGVNL